nr:MAG TPA: hypothetical protein [Bacteriophage sp.]
MQNRNDLLKRYTRLKSSVKNKVKGRCCKVVNFVFG